MIRESIWKLMETIGKAETLNETQFTPLSMRDLRKAVFDTPKGRLFSEDSRRRIRKRFEKRMPD
jgi:hypothetical protein